MRSISAALLGAVLALSMLSVGQAADKKYGPGVSDSEIKIGQTMPYSGPASAYGAVGRSEAAYFAMLNSKGGINGRKINVISLDDGYNPSKTVELTRRLVEDDQVLFMYGMLGTATSAAVQKYLNAKKVPQIMLTTGASKFNDPKNFPWTQAFYPSYRMEAHIYAHYLLQTKPNAKIAILYQDDDFGRDYLAGFKEALGNKAATMIVREESYQVADATPDSQIIALANSGADTFFSITTPKFAAQAIRKVSDLGWKPLYLIVSVATSIGAVLEPAGLDKSVGLISAVSAKTPLDETWKDDKDMQDYIAFMKEWNPQAKIVDTSAVTGYISAKMLEHILRQCGDDLTRENILKQVTNIDNVALPMLLPGIKIKTTPDDYDAYHFLQIQRFDGKRWVFIGTPIGG